MRSCRILRSPDADDSGGGPLPADELVTISRAELDELRARAAARADREQSEASASMTREAAHSREIADLDRKAAELDRAYKSALRDRELATALVGKPLVAGAAMQLIRLWRDEFEVVDEDGAVRVLAKDGRGVDQAVADRLSGPEFAHFCLPTSRGGTAARGQGRPASGSAPPPSAPKTLGDAALLRWREAAARPQGPPPPAGWGRRPGNG